ncbi:hypothetical protein BDF20DRAFT_854635 [Mycotypha africana]|uniref:uncharacterized protein n=1 Tax=Mycotypha africana TaxID=64632 RepID=UPI002300D98A|nr:uncharacterized protein BDF20DRAFT_854635 [Mycotypha africana]KAI8988243.1 hypothetical protein BDF20DRAFT_854635 [Mycotypha africana]
MPPKKNKGMEDITPISKDKEEEMSSALIAQLLAEDAMAGNDHYYAEYSNDSRAYDPYQSREEFDDSYEDNSEDEFNPKKKYTPKYPKAKRGRKRKSTVRKDEEAQEAPTSDKDLTTSEVAPVPEKKVNKKPRKPVPEGYNTGIYTDLEEQKFIEALELFGRDWTKVQTHVGTRDANSIRSHAQKHFIKLYRDQIPLPEKVRESGEGYTLSGNPLDPNSSAAQAYLKRGAPKTNTTKKPPPAVEKIEDKKIVEPMEAMEITENKTEDKVIPASDETKVTDDKTAVAVNKGITEGVEKQTEALKISEKKEKAHTKSSTSSSLTTNKSDVYDSSGRTTYASTRLRKQRDASSLNYGQITKNEDPLTMIKCEPFIGKPGSNVSGCQPFEISVDSNVLLAMDFHAHLMETEIIGFLAGEWNNETKRMHIREAYPCKSIETGQNDVNVEMDPTSAIETRQIIEERDMKVVGWYHSHPRFIPDPSLVDIENQRNYQTLCREEHKEGEIAEAYEPFVGAIVGPYDPALPGSASVINWFHVSTSGSGDNKNVPKRLIYDLKENENISQLETERLFDLLELYKDSPERVAFAEHWRQDASETKLQKLIKSLGTRMPWVQKRIKDNMAVKDMFLEQVQAKLKDW